MSTRPKWLLHDHGRLIPLVNLIVLWCKVRSWVVKWACDSSIHSLPHIGVVSATVIHRHHRRILRRNYMNSWQLWLPKRHTIVPSLLRWLSQLQALIDSQSSRLKSGLSFGDGSFPIVSRLAEPSGEIGDVWRTRPLDWAFEFFTKFSLLANLLLNSFSLPRMNDLLYLLAVLVWAFHAGRKFGTLETTRLCTSHSIFFVFEAISEYTLVCIWTINGWTMLVHHLNVLILCESWWKSQSIAPVSLIEVLLLDEDHGAVRRLIFSVSCLIGEVHLWVCHRPNLTVSLGWTVLIIVLQAAVSIRSRWFNLCLLS